MDLDKDLIRELASLLEETGLSEIEISQDKSRVRVARGGTTSAVVSAPAAPAAAPASTEPPKEEGSDLASHPGAVNSPMVGTAYLAPNPDAPPFVQVGSEVREGQTLLIVEAMKTMNPIPAPKSGRISRILVQNAQAVEYDEVLMVIE